MQQNEIEKIANRVLSDFGITSSPFSHLKQICKKEKIIMKKASFSSQMDGAFSVINGDKYIFFNPSMSDGRKNFTKAHELGHFFLNHQLESGDAIWCYNNCISENDQWSLPRIETEANWFATFFLMPRQMIIDEFRNIACILGIGISRPLYVDNQNCNAIYWNLVSRHFATRFGVSKEALGYRLNKIGLINYNVK